MNDKLQTFLGIMMFYILLSYILGPILFYYLGEKTLINAGNGFIAGSIISILLWVTVGKKYI